VVKVRAAGKVKREQELSDAEKIQKKLDDQIEVRDAKSYAKNSDVGASEMTGVIADSLYRLWDELNTERPTPDAQLSAIEGARVIAGSLMYGIGGRGAPVKIKEVEQEFHFCKAHR